ncbi:MAG: hypothetical protein N4A33_03700 [Bacteriovoracaceae bacterium]|jgi:hypothetical protein|nr:hypothetical protein [Bacteriovoracaceae bacterium]
MKYICLFILIGSLVSCSRTSDEKLDIALDNALFYLTDNSCTEARSVLDDIGYKAKNYLYVSLYSSTYACEAGYSELDDVFPNLTSLNATGPGFISSLAAFSTSNEIMADSTVYTKILAAIEEITKNGAAHTDRVTNFGAEDAGDLGMQLMFMALTELGKFTAYYGDADASGVKGGGGSHDCMMNFSEPSVVPILSAGGTVCNTTAEGSADLDPANLDFFTKGCEGIVMLNIVFDTLSNITLSSNSSLGDLKDVSTMLAAVRTAAAVLEPAVANYDEFYTVAACESQATGDGTAVFQRVFAAYMENLYQ